ncbi:hypothetical protein RFI_35762, partial [Reticulomyxa filosa]
MIDRDDLSNYISVDARFNNCFSLNNLKYFINISTRTETILYSKFFSKILSPKSFNSIKFEKNFKRKNVKGGSKISVSTTVVLCQKLDFTIESVSYLCPLIVGENCLKQFLNQNPNSCHGNFQVKLNSKFKQLRQPNTYQVALDEQHQRTQYIKKLKGQQGALSKTIPSPESQYERSLLRNMESDKEIIQYLKESSSQNITLYAAAVKRCSELKYPNSIIRIIEIVQSKHIRPDVIFYTTILNHLGMWDKFDLQKHFFQQWFEKQQNQSNYQFLVPDIITFSTMIKGCRKRGDFKQALYYLHLMIDKYNIKPNLITCDSLLSVCANARDIQSAELIWNKMIHDFNIEIDISSINSMLN